MLGSIRAAVVRSTGAGKRVSAPSPPPPTAPADHRRTFMRPGDALYLPAGIVHGTYNLGPEELDFLPFPFLFLHLWKCTDNDTNAAGNERHCISKQLDTTK